MRLRDMSFIITDRCTAACKICFFGCRPQNSNALDKEIIKDYIDQFAENNPEAKVAFSGGEALMYREMLLECMSHAKKRGLSSTLVTNCSFAGTVEKTKNILQKLRENGLVSLAVSADVYHQEFIPLQNVKNVLSEGLSMGFKVLVHLMELGDDDSVSKTLEALRPEIYGARLIIYSVFPVGAALNQHSSEKFIRPLSVDCLSCPVTRCSLTAMYNGDLLICCLQFSRDIPFVKVGSFGKTTIENAITNISRNDFIYCMFFKGLSWYVELARRLGFAVAEKYSAPCHFCHEIFTNKDFIRAAVPFVEEEADKIRLQKLFSS